MGEMLKMIFVFAFDLNVKIKSGCAGNAVFCLLCDCKLQGYKHKNT